LHADRLGGFALPRRAGKTSGQVEIVTRARGMTLVTGWTTAVELRIDWPGGHAVRVPSINRPDVARIFDLPPATGFEFELPETARPLTLTVTWASGATDTVPVPHPSSPPTRAAKRRLRRAFLRDIGRALPAAMRWGLTRDLQARRQIKTILGLDTVQPGLPIDPRYLGPPDGSRATRPFTIILPVYNAFDMVTACLERLARNTDLDWHVIVIDDASTDARIRPHLRAWAAEQGDSATLLTLDENHGFVGAVNRGLALAEQRPGHVVVLNSDAMVPPNWASRLLAPLEADPQIASVTPMSNDAEIFSVPIMGETMPLQAGAVDRLDAIAQTMSLPPRLPSAPTGVGFCMAMSSDWVAMFPRFDTAFGRGYGEEVDWCQKVRARNGRHVGLPTLFVEHRGGQSFGSKVKQDLVFKANGMIARRYPSYDLDVQAFIGGDPLRTPRLALAIALAGETAPDGVPLFVAHSMGGGAEQALEHEIAPYTARQRFALVLRVGGTERWHLEVHGPTGVLSGTTGDLEVVQTLLAPVPILNIVYSCAVGDPDPVTVPKALLSLRRAGRPDTLEARVHDFFMVTPSYNLLNAAGQFTGPVGPDTADDGHVFRRMDGSAVPLADWQSAWHGLLSECREITAFSGSSRDLLLGTYPDLQDRIVVRPHALGTEVGVVAKPEDGKPRTLAVLGNINRQKGAQVLVDLAAHIRDRGGPRLVLIGNVDPSFALPSSVRLHGSYRRSDIATLAERYSVTDWLIPSIWPETFSFVTHEALSTGLPVYAFDIGAQGEAVRRSVNGHPVAFLPGQDHAAAIWAAIDGANRFVASAGPTGKRDADTAG
jgi:GT2 family glycosyltransferase